MEMIICDICKKPILGNGVEVKMLEEVKILGARKYRIFGPPLKKQYYSKPMDICERCMDKLEKKLTKEMQK